MMRTCPDPETHNLHTSGRWLYESCPACEGDEPFPRCTLCGKLSQEPLVPWSGQRLCMNCADEQLDLMAQAILEDGLVHIGQGVITPDHVQKVSVPGINPVAPWASVIAEDVQP